MRRSPWASREKRSFKDRPTDSLSQPIAADEQVGQVRDSIPLQHASESDHLALCLTDRERGRRELVVDVIRPARPAREVAVAVRDRTNGLDIRMCCGPDDQRNLHELWLGRIISGWP